VFEEPVSASADPKPTTAFYRVTPPSEQPNLPSNVFVTSIDVEEDLWPTHRQNPRKRPREEEHFDEEQVEEITLDYGVAEDNSQPQPEEIEAKFDTLDDVQSETVYPANALFAFKELDIDPATLTPQMVLKLARLVSQEGTACEVTLTRNSGGVAFGGEVFDDQDGEADEESKLSIDVTEMKANGWKVVI